MSVDKIAFIVSHTQSKSVCIFDKTSYKTVFQTQSNLLVNKINEIRLVMSLGPWAQKQYGKYY